MSRQDGDVISSVSSTSGHNKGLSGGLLSRFTFLRSGREQETTLPRRNSAGPINGFISEYALDGGPATLDPPLPDKPRRRKGSLRKTALLGFGHVHDSANQPQPDINRSTKRDALHNAYVPLPSGPDPHGSPVLSQLHADAVASSAETPSAATPMPSSDPRQFLSDDGAQRSFSTTSPPFGELSTTDEDESGSLVYQPLAALHPTHPSNSHLHPPPAPDSTSYFPPLAASSLARRHTIKRSKSPLSAGPSRAPIAVEEWDYSETEWWGWVVLVVTWIVFVVGMGSCLGVWSWAWDVGETPYAPPELEDDPTLPIVGYYPALIILTTVMAWVWVVIAWVGMKYFKHAKISGEDL